MNCCLLKQGAKQSNSKIDDSSGKNSKLITAIMAGSKLAYG